MKSKTDFAKLASSAEFEFSMNCAPIDIPLGFGGFKSGKIYEIRGPESRGKSTLALEFVFSFAEFFQKQDKKFRIKWIETESAFDAVRTIWMRPEIGPLFEIDEAETVEQAHKIMKDFLNECVAKGEYGIVVWDTLAAAKTDAQVEKDDQYGGGQMEQARYLRYMLRDITQLLGKAGAPLILPNQTYTGKPKSKNPMAKPPEISYGGGAIRYHSSVRIDIQEKVEAMTELAENGEQNEIGIITNNHIMKNKLTGVKLPFHLWINNENGLDKIATTVGYLKAKGLVKIQGAWKKVDGYDGKEISWRSDKEIADKISEVDPKIKDWFDYLIYSHYAKSSPLVKLNISNRVWEYEKMFFGEKRMELTEKEILVGKRIEEFNKKQQEKEDQEILEESGKNSKKAKAKKQGKTQTVVELG